MSRRKKNWSRVPGGCLTPRLTVGRNVTSTSNNFLHYAFGKVQWCFLCAIALVNIFTKSACAKKIIRKNHRTIQAVIYWKKHYVTYDRQETHSSEDTKKNTYGDICLKLRRRSSKQTLDILTGRHALY
jgi:hypothetical protein